MKDERLLNAFNAWEELSQTSESVIAYQSRLKTIIDEEAKIDYAAYKGREEGKEAGKKEVILAGSKNNLDVGTLALITGYTEQQVEKILNENA